MCIAIICIPSSFLIVLRGKHHCRPCWRWREVHAHMTCASLFWFLWFPAFLIFSFVCLSPFKWKKTQKKVQDQEESLYPQPATSLPTLWRDRWMETKREVIRPIGERRKWGKRRRKTETRRRRKWKPRRGSWGAWETCLGRYWPTAPACPRPVGTRSGKVRVWGRCLWGQPRFFSNCQPLLLCFYFLKDFTSAISEPYKGAERCYLANHVNKCWEEGQP